MSHAHVTFDLQPRFHSVLCDLNDPLVILHREACIDSPPGWTLGGRALEFHREESVKQERVWQACYQAKEDRKGRGVSQNLVPALDFFLVSYQKKGMCWGVSWA